MPNHDLAVAAPAAVERTAPPTPAAWDLDTRMELAAAAMDARLQLADLAHSVNTAHLAVEPLDLADVIRIPVTAPRTPVDLYPTPVAALLQRAHQRLTTDGWRKGALVDAEGARCLWGAIRAEAGSSGVESAALDVLMDTIRREFPDAESVPSFNDAWADARMPLRLLQQAADHAGTRGL